MSSNIKPELTKGQLRMLYDECKNYNEYQIFFEIVSPTLSDKIILFCDYKKKDLESIKYFLDDLPFMKHVDNWEHAYKIYFTEHSINYYSIRDFIRMVLWISGQYAKMYTDFIKSEFDKDILITWHDNNVLELDVNSKSYNLISDLNKILTTEFSTLEDKFSTLDWYYIYLKIQQNKKIKDTL